MKLPTGIFSIPNMLCYFRIVYIPVMVVLFYLDYIWQAKGISWPAWTNVALYTLAGLSDFLDGRIARATNQSSIFGKFLDASTDKLLVGVSLLCLVAFHKLEDLWLIPAILIYMREILISGVREFMALYNVNIAISWMGKWKLTLQMLFIGFLIAGDYGPDLVPYAVEIGRYGFLLATFLTLWSGGEYLREAWKTMQRLEAEGKI